MVRHVLRHRDYRQLDQLRYSSQVRGRHSRVKAETMFPDMSLLVSVVSY